MVAPGAFDIVNRAFAAMSANDLDTVRELMSPDVAYHLVNKIPSHQRMWNGFDEFEALEHGIQASTKNTYQSAVVALHAAGPELVIVHGQTSATFDGRSCHEMNWVIVARVVDGKIVQMVDTPETALDNFWRPPKSR
jgi:ketosteroid isomerase-like protein